MIKLLLEDLCSLKYGNHKFLSYQQISNDIKNSFDHNPHNRNPQGFRRNTI